MQPKIFLLKESRHNEKRVALIPSDVAQLIHLGVRVYVEDSAGVWAGYSNEDYLSAGASIRQINYNQVDSYQHAFSDIDIIVRVKRPDRAREKIENSVIKPHTKMVGLLDILERDSEHISEYQRAKIDYYSLDQFLFPAHTPMDSLKEMSRIAGKLALEHAIEIFNAPVRHVSIIGSGEAGTTAYQECMKRNLPHTVITSDRYKSKLLSLQGIHNVVVERHLSLKKRQDRIYQVIKDTDIVIAAASTAWIAAPMLIPESTLLKLKSGTTLVDLAVSDGSNVFGSQHDATVTLSNNVKIINVSGYPKELPVESSRAWSIACCYFLHLLLTSHDTLIKLKYC
ncbi:NAD(P) transhydrogenase subunit alpha [Legionella gratiana]|uniref:NAD(P) transhydrogenase subunit alpha n=1 Tax=Legionella gratiana TaxID=45066 RepID=A0A378IZS5_9GAMM|nr:alanine dehydrogenase [Legionella gratiana]KTD11693.1 NAD(P) transhydrogenase subunit alpha [Legionella gratiana]STX40835.1 NAD(P) transhydrogenase subunit alpha [Legionella gratiana]